MLTVGTCVLKWDGVGGISPPGGRESASPISAAASPAPPHCTPCRPPAAPQQARGAAGGREGAQRAAILGARERRAIPRALLHHPDPRAAQRQVGPALSLCEPQRLRLRRGQVRPPSVRQHLRSAPPGPDGVSIGGAPENTRSPPAPRSLPRPASPGTPPRPRSSPPALS